MKPVIIVQLAEVLLYVHSVYFIKTPLNSKKLKNMSLLLKRVKEASESFGTILKRFLVQFYSKNNRSLSYAVYRFRDILTSLARAI